MVSLPTLSEIPSQTVQIPVPTMQLHALVYVDISMGIILIDTLSPNKELSVTDACDSCF